MIETTFNNLILNILNNTTKLNEIIENTNRHIERKSYFSIEHYDFGKINIKIDQNSNDKHNKINVYMCLFKDTKNYISITDAKDEIKTFNSLLNNTNDVLIKDKTFVLEYCSDNGIIIEFIGNKILYHKYLVEYHNQQINNLINY